MNVLLTINFINIMEENIMFALSCIGAFAIGWKIGDLIMYLIDKYTD